MHKGFVFTTDAAIAANVAILLTVILIGFMSINASAVSKEKLNSVGNDFLAVLERTGVFNSYIGKTQSAVNADILQQLQILPENYCGNVTVRWYKYSNGFVLENTFNGVKQNCVKTSEVTKSKRVLVDFPKQKFGIAEIELWLK